MKKRHPLSKAHKLAISRSNKIALIGNHNGIGNRANTGKIFSNVHRERMSKGAYRMWIRRHGK